MTPLTGSALLTAYTYLAADPTRTDREEMEMHHYAMALQEDWVETETPDLRWVPGAFCEHSERPEACWPCKVRLQQPRQQSA